MTALRTLALLSLIAGFSSSQTSDCSYYSLLDHLNLIASNSALQIVRPAKNWTTATLVQLDMFLLGILDVDEKSQTITNHIWLYTSWTNEFLTWNSSEFCGIKKISVPRSMLWIPDVRINEDVSDTGSIQDSPLVILNSSGWMYTSARQRLTYTCRLDLMMFPFDTQYCNITFSPMSSEEDAIHLGTFNSDKVLSKISEEAMVTMGEWDLKRLIIFDEPTARSTLKYMVIVERKPLLYIINFIMPLFFFLVLDLASFFINEARGEKLSFKVTLLLSISVLLLILQDMLPSTEKNLPMMAMYCVGVFTLVGISVLEAMLITFLIDFDGFCGEKAQSSVSVHEDIQLEVSDLTGIEEEKDLLKSGEPGKLLQCYLPDNRHLLKLILEEVRAVRKEAERRDKDKKRGCCRRLAEITDRVFFVLYLIVSALFLVFMCLSWIQKLI
ncbi:5-hydroxytryptamine receptor 3A-like [Archocentrus centrarchus]|uniref:5-hydroxytryptamine receptor 3A-like n=1 Tax=Archocentrus centrarchus TaxID=63155 RepID=UPI0011E9DEEE|nr:5-hydroxytryptamine receptor 3A-like [Archocentrus centrarchus]